MASGGGYRRVEVRGLGGSQNVPSGSFPGLSWAAQDTLDWAEGPPAPVPWGLAAAGQLASRVMQNVIELSARLLPELAVAAPASVARVSDIFLDAAGGGPTDWFGVGLVLAIVGGFLLTNAILFRHPRSLVAAHFGGAPSRLGTIREYIFHRLQVHLGFLFLLSGFGLQLYGRYRPAPATDVSLSFPTAWVGGILLAVAVLEVAGWWLSHQLFRRYVREHFLRNPPDLETDMHLARELGELFGIQSTGDDTVQSYLARIRAELGLSMTPRSATPRRPAEEPREPEEDEAALAN